jgi:hypothetical protein
MMEDRREKSEEAKSQVASNKFQSNNQVANFKLQTITKAPITKRFEFVD